MTGALSARWQDTPGPDAVAIRTAVFVREQGFEREFDAHDAPGAAHHLVLYVGQQAVAVCRCFPLGEDEWQIGRIAVLAPNRGRGLGRTLLTHAEQKIAQLGGKTAVVGAQQRAQGFYAALGYCPVGAPYEDEGRPHVCMRKTLAPPRP